jgi:parallel beta-helix repeat protein
MSRERRLFTEGYGKMKLKAVSGIMLKLFFTGVLMLALNIKSVEVAASEGPIAFFVYVPATVYSGDTITFDANDSYDPDGYIANYTWDFDDGSPIFTTSNPVTTHIYLVGLTYNVTLTVTDNDGLTDTKVHGVEVIPHCRHLYIWADGRIDPPTINITTVDNVTYIFTGNTYGNLYVERNNIVIDGVGYTLQGPGIYEGIALFGMNNITIKNIKIQAYDYGIYLHDSYNNSISGNKVTDNVWGIGLGNSFNNTIYHNNFVDNTAQTLSINSINIWDNGYPSGGNYWSNYTGVDANGDSIGDTPYVIDANNTDNYPLMKPWPCETGSPVGGISIPVNKLELLAPYIGLATLLAVAVVTVVYVKKRKRHTTINS